MKKTAKKVVGLWRVSSTKEPKVFDFGSKTVAIGPTGLWIERVKEIVFLNIEYWERHDILVLLSVLKGIESVENVQGHLYLYRDYADTINGSWESILPRVDVALKEYFK